MITKCTDSVYHCGFCAAANPLQAIPQRFTELMPLLVVHTLNQCLRFSLYESFEHEEHNFIKILCKHYSAKVNY